MEKKSGRRKEHDKEIDSLKHAKEEGKKCVKEN